MRSAHSEADLAKMAEQQRKSGHHEPEILHIGQWRGYQFRVTRSPYDPSSKMLHVWAARPSEMPHAVEVSTIDDARAWMRGLPR